MPHSALADWTLPPNAATSGRGQLWCFPYAGGGASIFHGWAEALEPVAECLAVQLPGRENRLREPPLAEWPELLDALAAALGPELQEPYALFGHSMGGLIAFEFARRMVHEGYPAPTALFVAGCRPPEQNRRGERLLHTLPEDDFVADLQRHGGAVAAPLDSPEIRGLVLPVLRADFKLVETYRWQPGPPLDCPLIVYGGEGDGKAPPEALHTWAKQSTAEFRQQDFPGGHFFLRPAKAELLGDLKAELDRRW